MRTIPLLLASLLLAPVAGAQVHGARPDGDMARIPAGSYTPLYDRGEGAVPVRAFRMDRRPVTRADYRAFVSAEPQWRRDRVRPLFADAGYLRSWPSPLSSGTAADDARPVTQVSWFAAVAYCRWRDARLPTMDEWEYVAAADAHRRDAMRDPAAAQARLTAYARPRPDPLPPVGSTEPNLYGVRDLHGITWEWTDDFNSVLVADDSRGTSARDQGLFCASGAVGATNLLDYASFLRYAVRAGLQGRTTLSTLGFRCAAS